MGDMTPWRLLDEREPEWRELLAGVSLAAEIDVAPEDSRAVLASLGTVYAKLGDASKPEKEAMLARRPACLVVGMSGLAATDYKEGAYWPKLWEVANLKPSQTNQSFWGKAFLGALARLGLPRFKHSRQMYLGPILMHCGIPTYCLPDLLRMLVEHEYRDPGLDAASFVQWVTGGPSRMNGLDKPVQHFIEYGGEYAYDIIDRLLDLLDRLRDPKPSLFTVGLPERLIAETRRVKSLGLLGNQSGPRRTANRNAAGSPRLALDPFGEGPRILLSSNGMHWRVVVDGHPHDVSTALGWPGDELDETTFPLPGPAGHVQVRPLDRTATTEITVVRKDDPLLVFSEDGEFLPPGRPLPQDVVWVLYPEDRDLRPKEDLREVSEAFLPFGWQGWTLLEVDLSGAKSLGLSGGSTRDIRASVGPHLRLPPPLPGITASHRQPVYNAPPLIELPVDRPRSWSIEVRPASQRSDTALVRMTARSGDVDPWRGMPHPVIGTFDISILGPLGFRLHRRIAVAEGLTAAYEPSVRLFTRTGLDPVTVHLTGQAEPSQANIALDERQRELTVTYGSERFVVSPPHMTVLHDNRAGGARWSTMPLSLTAESLTYDRAGTLLVRVPDIERLPSLLVVGADITQQVQSHGMPHQGQARYPLTQLTDTVEATSRLDMLLRIRDRDVAVAFVRPQALASGVARSGNRLKLVNCAQRPGLHVGIYAVYQPWRGVTVLLVRADGSVDLPVHLKDAGSLRVLPGVQDASVPWPYWPPFADSFLVRSPLRGPSARDPLTAFLAGNEPCPATMPPERMWLFVLLASQLEADGAREDLHGQCDMALRSNPVRALLALANTSLNPAEAVVEIVRSGLADQQIIGTVEVGAVRRLLGRLRIVAALLGGSVLADPHDAAELLELVEHDHGAELAAVLSGESDPYQPSGPGGGESPLLTPPLRLVTDAAELLNATPYCELTARIQGRAETAAKASAALALAMRVAAGSRGSGRNFRSKYRPFWTELARANPDLVSLDIIAAQAAIAAIDRRTRAGELRDRDA